MINNKQMEKLLHLKDPNYSRMKDDLEMVSLVEKEESRSSEEWLESAGHSTNLKLERRESKLLSPGLSSETVLYKDTFITISPTKIKINNYYFPFGKPKTINLTDIVSLATPEAMSIPWWGYMNWGRGYHPIWWARDEDRGLHRKYDSIILKERNESTLKAFSVVVRQEVMDILRERLMLC